MNVQVYGPDTVEPPFVAGHDGVGTVAKVMGGSCWGGQRGQGDGVGDRAGWSVCVVVVCVWGGVEGM